MGMVFTMMDSSCIHPHDSGAAFQRTQTTAHSPSSQHRRGSAQGKLDELSRMQATVAELQKRHAQGLLVAEAVPTPAGAVASNPPGASSSPSAGYYFSPSLREPTLLPPVEPPPAGDEKGTPQGLEEAMKGLKIPSPSSSRSSRRDLQEAPSWVPSSPRPITRKASDGTMSPASPPPAAVQVVPVVAELPSRIDAAGAVSLLAEGKSHQEADEDRMNQVRRGATMHPSRESLQQQPRAPVPVNQAAHGEGRASWRPSARERLVDAVSGPRERLVDAVSGPRERLVDAVSGPKPPPVTAEHAAATQGWLRAADAAAETTQHWSDNVDLAAEAAAQEATAGAEAEAAELADSTPRPSRPSPTPLCGWLWKKGTGSSFFGRRNWKRRFFRLRHGELSYHEQSGEGSPPLGTHSLHNTRSRKGWLWSQERRENKDGRFVIKLTLPGGEEVRVGASLYYYHIWTYNPRFYSPWRSDWDPIRGIPGTKRMEEERRAM
jgi:hypothetical protein